MEIPGPESLRRSFRRGHADLDQGVSGLSQPPAQELLPPRCRVPFLRQQGGASLAEGSAAARASVCRLGAPGSRCIAGGSSEGGATRGIATLGFFLRRRLRRCWHRRRIKRDRRLWLRCRPCWRRSRSRRRQGRWIVRACWVGAELTSAGLACRRGLRAPRADGAAERSPVGGAASGVAAHGVPN